VKATRAGETRGIAGSLIFQVITLLMIIPSTYVDGYEKGREVDTDRATNYVTHSMIGDPLADAMIADCDPLGQKESSRLIKLGMTGDDDGLRDAPESVREFFASMNELPDWVDLSSFLPGCSLFHRNTRLVLAGMVGGVLIEGFSTNIAQSFFLTGRLRDQGIRRLKQNNRHMLEIFMPGGMDRFADGWTHSVRVRLVHARVRYLLSKSDEWDVEELGTPISAAHVGFAISAFSARLLEHLRSLGASFDEEESRSFMNVWRYSGYLMGIPETILFTDKEDALEIFRIGRLCEPHASLESIVMAASLINSAPLFAGLSQRDEQRKLANYVAQVSRALIGNELADELRYPKGSTLGILWKFRLMNRIEAVRKKLNPEYNRENTNMASILAVSMFDDEGISYKLPDHIYAERSSKW